jgi:hypothetical protein
MNQVDFLNVTIRARFLFGLVCVKNALTHYNLAHLNWSILFDYFQRYLFSNDIKGLALWHENEYECIPFCVLENISYYEKKFNYLTLSDYECFENLYQKSNIYVCQLIDLAAQVGTQNLYGGVSDGAKGTLDIIDQIIKICLRENIELPDFEYFAKYKFEFPIVNENLVWGERISKTDFNNLILLN